VILPVHVEASIVAHARRASPEECCGLLLGNGDRIVDATPVPNTARDPVRQYLIDPQSHFAAIRDARRRALSVIGVYHSHPQSSSTPSPTDRAEGFGQFVFLIVGLGAEPPEVAAWTWTDGNFTALPLVRLP
jgi:proteasome lid subunit RPN8/RPN11